MATQNPTAGSQPLKNAKNFTGIAVGACTPIPQGNRPTTITIDINWSDYPLGGGAPAGPVEISLMSGVTNPIDVIRSVKIDNLDCPSPMTLYFPDTKDEVVCSGNAAISVNVATAGLRCFAIMPVNTTNLGKTTRVLFNNFMVDPDESATFVATQTYVYRTGGPFSLSSIFTPTLGDRYFSYTLDLSLTGVASWVPLFGLGNPTAFPNNPPDGYNFVTIKNLSFDVIQNYSAGPVISLLNAAIVNDLGGATAYNFSWAPPNDLTKFDYNRVFEGVPTESNLPADSGAASRRKYYLQNNVASVGFARLNVNYTLLNIVNLP